MPEGAEAYCRLQALEHIKLPEPIFVAAFLAELHHLLPSTSNSFCWLNRQNAPVDFYDEQSTYSLSKNLSDAFSDKDDTLASKVSLWLERRGLLNTSDVTDTNDSLRHLYRQVFFPCGYHHSLILSVGQHRDRNKGILLVHRSRQQLKFSDEEAQRLSDCKKLLENGLARNEDFEYQATTSGWQSGLVIVDPRAQVVQCCPVGINLLALATQCSTGQFGHNRLMDVRALPGIHELIQSVLNDDTGVSNSITTQSVWGEFQISAYPVTDEIGHRAPQIYLNINWQIPFSLRVFHNIRFMALTPRQEIIALLYAIGQPTKMLANTLDLSLYTVKEHIHNIFDKLQIHTRAELIEEILCCQQETSGRQLKQGKLNRAERATMNISRP